MESTITTSCKVSKVYKVRYYDHGHPRTSGGHTLASAQQALARLTARAGIRDALIVETAEVFGDVAR